MKACHTFATIMALATFAIGGEEPKAGDADESGHLILHVLHSVDHPPVPLPVLLKDDYGFMIFNVGTMEEPKLMVKIGARKDKNLHEAPTWEEVDKILAKIPEGSLIHYYGQCLCPTYYGLPADTWDRWYALIEKHKLTYDNTQRRITCVCQKKTRQSKRPNRMVRIGLRLPFC